MLTGTLVKNSIVIQSDDRSIGIDDNSPIIPIGTIGRVLGMSKEAGCEDCVVVAFETKDGIQNYDVHLSEIFDTSASRIVTEKDLAENSEKGWYVIKDETIIFGPCDFKWQASQFLKKDKTNGDI
jgi:hypothetical protein